MHDERQGVHEGHRLVIILERERLRISLASGFIVNQSELSQKRRGGAGSAPGLLGSAMRETSSFMVVLKNGTPS
jgi:hypothetical protein